MSFWSSNTISCYQLIIPRQNAHRIIQLIGRLGNIQFTNQKDHNDKPFLAQIKLIEQSIIKLDNLQQIISQNQNINFPSSYNKIQYEKFLDICDRRYRRSNNSQTYLLQLVIEQIQQIWNSYHKLLQKLNELKKQTIKLKQQLGILNAGQHLFSSKLYQHSQYQGIQNPKIQFKCGVLLKKDQIILRRTLFRITKGLNKSTKQQKQQQNIKSNKVIFFVLFGYGESNTISSKVQKLLNNYDINSYIYPKTKQQQIKLKNNIYNKIDQNIKLYQLVNKQILSIIKILINKIEQQNKFYILQYYKLYLIHQKIIYQKLNHMKLYHNFYQAYIFIQSQYIQYINNTINQLIISERLLSPQFIPFQSKEKPTLFHLNSVTSSPYQILSAYGIPHYKQVNPAFFNLITFPFLFGIMFGDIAHGLILFSIGIYLINKPIQNHNPIISKLQLHKYTVTLMGFFAFYCGLIYNDYLSISFNIFGTCYQIQDGKSFLKQNCVYPFGIDPIWSISQNNLNFTNSLKMKIAVIIAIIHMTLGILVKSFNFWKFGKKFYILIQIIPEILFILSIFGYMDFLIIYKWIHTWGSNPPSIITTMMNIVLQLGATTDCCGGQPMWGTYGQTSQNKIQITLLIIALSSVPIMFIFPLAYQYLKLKIKKQNQKQLNFNQQLAQSNIQEKQQLIQSIQIQKDLEFNQIWVNRFIETIEFVLGCISNTASYLRLWALSLAHSQLSDVFFSQIVQRGLQKSFIGILYVILSLPRIFYYFQYLHVQRSVF